MPHRNTVNERVKEAAERIERAARQDPHFHEDTPEKEEIFKKACDPNSDWPEPPLRGEHIQKEMARWLPPESPRTRASRKHRVNPISHPGIGGGDEVEAVNREVGHFTSKETPHGRHGGAGMEGGPLDVGGRLG